MWRRKSKKWKKKTTLEIFNPDFWRRNYGNVQLKPGQ